MRKTKKGLKTKYAITVRDISVIFVISDFFRSCAIECCQPSLTKANPCCHSDEIWNKMGYNSGCTIGMLI